MGEDKPPRPPPRPPVCGLRLYISAITIGICLMVAFAPETIFSSVVQTSGFPGYVWAVSIAAMAVVSVADVLINDWAGPAYSFSFAANWRGRAYCLQGALHITFAFVILQYGFDFAATVLFWFQAGASFYVGAADVWGRFVKPRLVALRDARG